LDIFFLNAFHINFEFKAQLDSVISENERTSSKEFTIRDTYERMRCIFYEIDRPMEKLTRGSWIRFAFDFK
jgi:hypothetical protein